MYLHRYEDLYEKASAISDIPEPLIRLVCTHYFLELKKNFYSMNSAAVHLPGLGSFYVWIKNYRMTLKKLLIYFRKCKEEGIEYPSNIVNLFRQL
jgi:hypothetical protein